MKVDTAKALVVITGIISGAAVMLCGHPVAGFFLTLFVLIAVSE